MRNLWKALIAAVAFALGALLVWELWLKQVWEALVLPRLHHYWYGIFLMSGALGFHLAKADKRIRDFLFTVGLIWFGSDFPDFVAHFGWVVAIIVVILLALIPIVMLRGYVERRLTGKSRVLFSNSFPYD